MQSGREDTLEERYAIKFCFKLGQNATETYGMLQTAFGAFCMNRAPVVEWHKRFKEGRESGVLTSLLLPYLSSSVTELMGQRIGVTFWVTKLRF